ncbi:uncharacterized protein [Clytia hemisphaerica]|uniref:JmjC domain-containing protein n=1 Tax=Clytia hemisphaerica TaxID=252671 RepID=A0A7M6DL71_9CNID|eukprot:TCONS_00017594-protein
MERIKFCFILISLLNFQSCFGDASSPFHLKPLGSHIPATEVTSVDGSTMITPNAFMQNFVLPRQPLVFRGIGKLWPAFEKWNDEYLKENYPNLELRMEGRKEKQSNIPQGDIALGRDSMKHFIETYQEKDTNKYVVSELPTPLYKYVNIPPPLGCGELKQRFTEINLWINSGGASSILHKDSPNIINCVVNGTKEWKLIEFKHNHLIYQAWEGPQEAGYGGYSLINPEKVDVEKFPNILEIPQWYHVTVNAGDCLYVPTQTWHVVKSYGKQNVAVSFLLSQFFERTMEDIDLAECGDIVPGKDISLNEIDVDWQYPGFGNMTMGYSDMVDYMQDIEFFFSPKTQKLSKKRIFHILMERHDGVSFQKEKCKQRTNQIFKIMNEMAPDGKITSSFVKELAREQLRDIIRLVEPHYSAGTLEHEYSHFTPQTLKEMCENLAKQNNGVLRKSDFVKMYLEANGSLKFAEDFWSKLVGLDSMKDEVVLSEIVDNLPNATFNYAFYGMEEEGSDDSEEYENRNDIPRSDFVSEPRGAMPDFNQNEGEEKKQKMKSNLKTEL